MKANSVMVPVAAASLRTHMFLTREHLFDAMVHRLDDEISKARGGEVFALAGGETPQAVYRGLSEAPDRPQWPFIRICPTDERCVEADSPRRNDAMLRDCLGSRARVFSLEEGAEPPPLHLALLGMGEDGHIASLFPPNPPLDGGPIFRTTPDGASESRLTIPMPSFLEAKKIFLMFCGEKKWSVLSQIKAPPEPLSPVAALLLGATMKQRQVELFYAP